MDKFCCVCLEDIKKNEKFLRCTHVFHKNCIDRWERENPSCPVCKTPMYEDGDSRNARSNEYYAGQFSQLAGPNNEPNDGFTDFKTQTRPPAFQRFVANTTFALASMMSSQPTHEVKYNPYIAFLGVITSAFARDVIKSSYPTIRRQVQMAIEEKSIPVVEEQPYIEKALILKWRLESDGVDLSDIPTQNLSRNSTRDVNGFIYIKLLEKRDEIARQSMSQTSS